MSNNEVNEDTFKNQLIYALAERFKTSIPTIKCWLDGTCEPHQIIKQAVLKNLAVDHKCIVLEKDAERGPHELWCDTQNNISERCNCIVSTYIDKLEDYDELIKEKDKYIAQLTNIAISAETERLKNVHESYEKQLFESTEIIKKLKQQRNEAIEKYTDPNWSEFYKEKLDEEIETFKKGWK